ncbi:MAG: hypothetical protein N3A65_08940 [candidate division WOR-3 bacterium]|nr:hypothetical protein [candidate division WOR-3 bacterium]
MDSNHSFPDIIILDLPYEKDTNGIHFSIVVKPGKVNSFKISYHQMLKNRYFRYITTTTEKWGGSKTRRIYHFFKKGFKTSYGLSSL